MIKVVQQVLYFKRDVRCQVNEHLNNEEIKT